MSERIKLSFVSVVFVFCLFSTKNVNAGDFENWTFVGGQTKIKNSNLFFHSANFFRYGNDYFLNHTQITLDFPSKRNVSFGIGYKQEYVDFVDFWRAEYRPMLHLYYKKDWGNFSFRDRSRWEFRFYDGDFINRYRNQVQLSFQKFNGIKPYVSTEFSFYFNKLDYTRQRTLLGALIPANHFTFNLFLGHQLNEDLPDVWNTKFMLGTGASYKF